MKNNDPRWRSSVLLVVRVSPEQHERIVKTADAMGKTLGKTLYLAAAWGLQHPKAVNRSRHMRRKTRGTSTHSLSVSIADIAPQLRAWAQSEDVSMSALIRACFETFAATKKVGGTQEETTPA